MFRKIIIATLLIISFVLSAQTYATNIQQPEALNVTKSIPAQQIIDAAMVETKGDSEKGKAMIEKMEGVYKHRWMNEAIHENKFPVEDIFEFVRVSDTSAYVNIVLNFYNGHMCGFSGIAEYKKNGVFLTQHTDKDLGENCTFIISLKGDVINFKDPDYKCSNFSCGARGSLNGDFFNLKQRRKIRYLNLILKSKNYQNALKEYQTLQPTK